MWSKTPFLIVVWIALFASTHQAEDQSLPLDPVLAADKAGNWKLVRAHCTSCHSSQIFKNLRLSRRDWRDVIKRMQAEEGMWELGESEPKVLDYLETYFGPETDSPRTRSRRAPIASQPRSPSN